MKIFRILLVALLIIVSYIIGSTQSKSEEVPSRVFITAAHIPESEFPGYTLMYKDEQRDTAYYLNPNGKSVEIPIGARIVINHNIKCTVVGTLVNDICLVQLDDPSVIRKGLSGSIASYRGEPIGFVSSLTEESKLKIILF